MTLNEWLKHKGLTQEKAAALFGVKQNYISRWTTGRHKPSLGFVLLIERKTKGAVPAESWADAGHAAKAG